MPNDVSVATAWPLASDGTRVKPFGKHVDTAGKLPFSDILSTEEKDKLQRAFNELSTCTDELALVKAISGGISDSVKEEIDAMLSVVGRMRAIGIESRKVTNPKSFSAAGYKGQPQKWEQPDRVSSTDQKRQAKKTDGLRSQGSRSRDKPTSGAEPLGCGRSESSPNEQNEAWMALAHVLRVLPSQLPLPFAPMCAQRDAIRSTSSLFAERDAIPLRHLRHMCLSLRLYVRGRCVFDDVASASHTGQRMLSGRVPLFLFVCFCHAVERCGGDDLLVVTLSDFPFVFHCTWSSPLFFAIAFFTTMRPS